jgi:pyruvate/2-oxoglutarate dehydrogenase complex dihydrolipoamide acyltransferase (E2) component
MAEFTMPKLGHLMEEGTVVSWKKTIGDKVEKGEIILEVEMDKATAEVESNLSGTLTKILVEQDKTVPVGEPLAIIE